MPSKEFVFKNDLGQINIRQTLVGHRCLYQFVPQSQTQRGKTQLAEERGGHWADNIKQPRVRERCYRWATFPNDFCEFHMKNNNVLVRKGLGDARNDGIAVEAFNRDAPMGGVLFHAGDPVAGAIRDGRNAQNKDATGFIETENAAEITNRYGDDGTRNPYVLKIGANQYIDGSINRSLPIMMDRSEANEQHNVKVMPGDEHTVGLHLHATKNIRNGEEMVVDAPPINTGNRITAKTVQKRGRYLAGRGGGGRMGRGNTGRGNGPIGLNNDPLFDPNLEYNEEVYSALAKNVAFTGPGSKKRARTEYDSDSEDESLRSRTPPPPPPSPPPSDWNYDPDKDLTVADFNKQPEKNKKEKKKTKKQLLAEEKAAKALANTNDPLSLSATTLPARNEPNKRNKTNTGELIFQLPLSASQVAILTSILLEHPRIGDKALTQQARARFALKNTTMTEQQKREEAAAAAAAKRQQTIQGPRLAYQAAALEGFEDMQQRLDKERSKSSKTEEVDLTRATPNPYDAMANSYHTKRANDYELAYQYFLNKTLTDNTATQNRKLTREEIKYLLKVASQQFKQRYGNTEGDYADDPTKNVRDSPMYADIFKTGKTSSSSSSSSSSTGKNIITVTGKKPPGKDPVHLKPKPQEKEKKQPPAKKQKTQQAVTTVQPTNLPTTKSGRVRKGPADKLDPVDFDIAKRAAAAATKAAKEANKNTNKKTTKSKK